MTDLVAVGSRAPDFKATGHDGKTYELRDLVSRGPVLLAFYPANNTPGCDRQLSAMRDDIAQFQRAGVQPFGVNPASIEQHQKYHDKKGFNFPLLSDPEREVAGAFGALKPDGKGIQRSVVLIGRDGNVAFASRGAPGAAEVLEALGPQQ